MVSSLFYVFFGLIASKVRVYIRTYRTVPYGWLSQESENKTRGKTFLPFVDKGKLCLEKGALQKKKDVGWTMTMDSVKERLKRRKK